MVDLVALVYLDSHNKLDLICCIQEVVNLLVILILIHGIKRLIYYSSRLHQELVFLLIKILTMSIIKVEQQMTMSQLLKHSILDSLNLLTIIFGLLASHIVECIFLILQVL